MAGLPEHLLSGGRTGASRQSKMKATTLPAFLFARLARIVVHVLVRASLLALVATGCSAIAADAVDMNCDKEEQRLLRRGTTNFIFENDLFTKSDRQYTNGLKLSVTTPPISDGQKTKCLFEWVPGLNNLLLKFTAKGSNGPVEN